MEGGTIEGETPTPLAGSLAGINNIRRAAEHSGLAAPPSGGGGGGEGWRSGGGGRSGGGREGRVS